MPAEIPPPAPVPPPIPTTRLRVFEVDPVKPDGKSGDAHELEARSIPGHGDVAKNAARAQLKAEGLTIRSCNWSPGTNGNVELVAYVSKKVV